MLEPVEFGGLGGGRRLPYGSHLSPNGLPSECTYTPFWAGSYRAGAWLSSSSSSGCSLVYRGRGPEPCSLLTCFLGGFKPHDRSLPLGRASKKSSNPSLEVEIVNAVGVCYFDELLPDHPQAVCVQPHCCCCSARLPTDPDPYGVGGERKKAAAAAAAAAARTTTVLEEYIPYEALQEIAGETKLTPVLVLPCGLAHSALELVALSHHLDDVVYTRSLPRPSSSVQQQQRQQRGRHRKRLSGSQRRSSSDSSSSDTSRSGSGSSSSEEESATPTLGCGPEAPGDLGAFSVHAAGCSLGLEAVSIAELHPNTFQWTRGEGRRVAGERGPRVCSKQTKKSDCSGSSNSSSRGSTCCSCCCWCPMGDEVHGSGSVRNVYARGEARHAPDPLESIRPKESFVSERLLEVKTDDKHPFLKFIFARNARGLYVAKLKHEEEDMLPEEAVASLQAVGQRHQTEGLLNMRGPLGDPPMQNKDSCCGFEDGGVRRELIVQVIHDAPYGRRVPRLEGGSPQQQGKEVGSLVFSVPKPNPPQTAVINIAVSFANVGEAAFLYNSNVVSIWKAEEARMEVEPAIPLSVGSRSIRRASRPFLRYRHRTAFADPSAESFQTLCYSPHQTQTLLLGSDNLWALDLRAKSMTRLFPAMHAPTHGSTVQTLSESLYAPCTANSSYHTAFTALAPHPQHPFLLAAAHDATEAICLFDARAMHEPLTVIGLPSLRKMGCRYRSLFWHSSTDKAGAVAASEVMHPSSVSGIAARRAAVSAAAGAAAGSGQASGTYDLLSAFSWRNEDVVCSSLRVHPAYCPPNPVQTAVPSNRSRGSRGEGADRDMRLRSQRPHFEPSPLEVIRSGCLPRVVRRETVEISWQAEVCMFPRTSWGAEHRDRCQPISSRTPVGSSWLQKHPLQVTVDEVAATASFHGFAGACLLTLPISDSLRSALTGESSRTLPVPPRRLRCKVCGAKNPISIPKETTAAAPAAADAASAAAGSKKEEGRFPRLVALCRKCSSPISSLAGFGGVPESPGSITVLCAFTTSGRLTCRPLTVNDPVLQLRMQKRSRLYAQLAQRQRRCREKPSGIDLDPLPQPQAVEDAAAAVASSAALAALVSFHASRLSQRRFVATGGIQSAHVPESAFSAVSCVSAPQTPGTTAAGGVWLLLQQLQGSYNEIRVLPQRVPALLLQLQLFQSLQHELLFRAALRAQRDQQLQMLRRALTFVTPGAEVLLHVLKGGLEALQLQQQLRLPLQLQRGDCVSTGLASFAFSDSGSFGLHRPAFDTEAYDPEPLVQMLLAHAALDNCLLLQQQPAANSLSLLPTDAYPAPTQILENSPANKPTSPTEAEGIEADANNKTNRSRGSSSRGGLHVEEDADALEHAACVSSINNLLEGGARFDVEALGLYTAATETSGLPFPSARSRSIFRYAVETVEALTGASAEGSLLQLLKGDSVLLHHILIAVQLFREGRLSEAQALQLLRPFSVSRLCSPGLLDMRRTTLPLGFESPCSPQEAFAAAALSAAPPAAVAALPAPATAPPKGNEAKKVVFRKVFNPAIAPALPCCCRVLLQHHCDLHAACVPERRCVFWGQEGEAEAARGSYCTGSCSYPHTDGLQSLLALLKRKVREGLFGGSSNTALREAVFVPQAVVDELAETLFLTHEVLLLPQRDPAANSIFTNNGGVAEGSACHSAAPGARAADGDSFLTGFSSTTADQHVLLPVHMGERPQVPPEIPGGVGTATTQRETAECPISSVWLPSYCLSRHLHCFLRKDSLVAEEDAVQQELQRHAWPDLLLQQQRSQAAQTAAAAAAPTRNAWEPLYSEYPRGPVLNLPLTMQSLLPDHVLEGLRSSKWKRLLCGVAVNGVILADLLRHWEVPVLQRVREIQDTHQQQQQRVWQQDQSGDEDSRDQDRDLDRTWDPHSSNASQLVNDLPEDAQGAVYEELQRLLLLLQPTHIPLHFSIFVNVQQRQQEQRRMQAERQQLLDSIARAMRQRT